ncbi:MAG TPA: hypothetical protein DDZ67_09135 [Xanthomonadaceae bacterium]|nr:hypothetical protein [Xanthomonadaceae bacterium]
MQKFIRNTTSAVGAFASRARNLIGVGAAVALASPPVAFAQSVASEIGGSAQTELTGAQTIIIGLLTTLVLIAIGFVVYSLIKKAR